MLFCFGSPLKTKVKDEPEIVFSDKTKVKDEPGIVFSDKAKVRDGPGIVSSDETTSSVAGVL